MMDYYDGNTVTELWNYAQQYAMSDNSFGTTFGPSRPARSTWPRATPATST
jgi:phospholipase C